MPQGKGTYGSQVGRPPKKKYKKGDKVKAAPKSTRTGKGKYQKRVEEYWGDTNFVTPHWKLSSSDDLKHYGKLMQELAEDEKRGAPERILDLKNIALRDEGKRETTWDDVPERSKLYGPAYGSALPKMFSDADRGRLYDSYKSAAESEGFPEPDKMTDEQWIRFTRGVGAKSGEGVNIGIFGKGGKVEASGFGFPSSDARNRSKKG